MESMRLTVEHRAFIYRNVHVIDDAAAKLVEAGADARLCDDIRKAGNGIYRFINEEWNKQQKDQQS
jgi:hypothetical protein